MTISDIPGAPRRTTVRIVRMREVRKKVGLSQSHLYALISQGRFPAPFPIVPGGRAKGWFESTLDAYLTERKVEA